MAEPKFVEGVGLVDEEVGASFVEGAGVEKKEEELPKGAEQDPVLLEKIMYPPPVVKGEDQ